MSEASSRVRSAPSKFGGTEPCSVVADFGASLAGIAPDLVELGPIPGQVWSKLAVFRPTSFDIAQVLWNPGCVGPIWAIASKIGPHSTKLGLDSTTLGAVSAKFGAVSAQFGASSAELGPELDNFGALLAQVGRDSAERRDVG